MTKADLDQTAYDAAPLADLGHDLMQSTLPVMATHLPSERERGAEGVAYALVRALFAALETSSTHPIHAVRGIGRAVGAAFPDADAAFNAHLELELAATMRAGQADALLASALGSSRG